MIKELSISVKPSEAANSITLKTIICKKSGIDKDSISHFEIIKRSIDARRYPVWIRMKVRLYTHSDKPTNDIFQFHFTNVCGKTPVIIAGTGPAGLFAALKLIESGVKPVLIERGKDVSNRKKDIARINREYKINPDSNYCFGEGGAGTFSDGKLYTRSTKRGDVKRILQLMVFHGSSPDILIDALPHIGSDKLLPLITNIRKTILDCGGEIYFDSRVSKIIKKNNRVTAFVDQKGIKYEGKYFMLATGHSARDTYNLLHDSKLPLLPKPFAIGVRVEHPQKMINAIQYHSKNPDPFLPPATYSLTAQSEGYGVFSFCMCPGGTVVPAATREDQIVVNGMSNSKRDSPFANSGIVTEIKVKDLEKAGYNGPLAGILFQEELEQKMKVGGKYSPKAPAQRLTDFLENRYSANIPASSYYPGLQSSQLNELLPVNIVKRLQDGFLQFNKKMKGFITEEAVVIGAETRTSSPVRIPRNPISLSHIILENLYPCGEGAGYSGGIISSAIDGENAAKAIIEKIKLS